MGQGFISMSTWENVRDNCQPSHTTLLIQFLLVCFVAPRDVVGKERHVWSSDHVDGVALLSCPPTCPPRVGLGQDTSHHYHNRDLLNISDKSRRLDCETAGFGKRGTWTSRRELGDRCRESSSTALHVL